METTLDFDALAEAAAPIVDQVRRDIVDGFATYPFNRTPRTQAIREAVKKAAENPELFAVSISADRLFENGEPHLNFGIINPEEHFGGVGIELPAVMVAKIKALPDGDFQTLVEYSGAWSVKRWEDVLAESTPEHLAADYNGCYTNQELYEMNIREAKWTLERVQAGAADPKGTVKVRDYGDSMHRDFKWD